MPVTTWLLRCLIGHAVRNKWLNGRRAWTPVINALPSNPGITDAARVTSQSLAMVAVFRQTLYKGYFIVVDVLFTIWPLHAPGPSSRAANRLGWSWQELVTITSYRDGGLL